LLLCLSTLRGYEAYHFGRLLLRSFTIWRSRCWRFEAFSESDELDQRAGAPRELLSAIQFDPIVRSRLQNGDNPRYILLFHARTVLYDCIRGTETLAPHSQLER